MDSQKGEFVQNVASLSGHVFFSHLQFVDVI